MYEYFATVDRVLDGDTLDLHIDVGFSVTVRMRVRLNGINTPEVFGAEKVEGKAASAFVKSALPVNARVLIHTHKLEKYGRYVADVWYVPGAPEASLADLRARGVDLGKQLLSMGMAEAVTY